MQKKISVNVCFAFCIFSVFVHVESQEPDSCWYHAKLASCQGPVPNCSDDFSSPAVSSLIFLSDIYHEQKKHLLHIALLNDSDRLVLDLLNAYCLWQAGGGKNMQLLQCPLNSYSHGFAVATSVSPGELLSTAEGSSVLRSFDQKRRLQLRTDWLLVRVWGRGKLPHLRLPHWTRVYLNIWLTSLSTSEFLQDKSIIWYCRSLPDCTLLFT